MTSTGTPTQQQEPTALWPDAPELLAWRVRDPEPVAVLRCCDLRQVAGKPCRRKAVELWNTPNGPVVVFYRESPDMPVMGAGVPLTRQQGREPGQLKRWDAENASGLTAGTSDPSGTVVGLVDEWHDIVLPGCPQHGWLPQVSRDTLLNLHRAAGRRR